MQFFNDMVTLFTRYNSFFLEGIRNTLIIAAFSVLIGTVLGTLMAMMRMSKIAPLRFFALGYIEFIRGTPLMVQLMFIFYGLPMIGVRFPDISFIPDFNRFAAGIVAMSINSCAYVAEIIRSGIQAVDTGQMEAARSIGYSQAQAMTYVVLPQAIRNILPALGNEFVVNIKDTSVLNVISVTELFFVSKSAAGTYFKYYEVFFITACIYFVMTFTVTRLLRWIEKKMDGPENYAIHGSQTVPDVELIGKGGEQNG